MPVILTESAQCGSDSDRCSDDREWGEMYTALIESVSVKPLGIKPSLSVKIFSGMDFNQAYCLSVDRVSLHMSTRLWFCTTVLSASAE